MGNKLLTTAMKEHNIDLTDAEVLKFGGDNDYMSINKTDGTLRNVGESTVWKDMIADLFGKRLYSNTGRVDYDYDENAIKFQNNGDITSKYDRVGGNQEINHEFKIGSSITFRPHIHWFQDSFTEYIITARYRLQNNGQPKTEIWTPVETTVNATNNVYTYTSGVLNQLTRFPDIVVDCDVSDTIQFQMTRSDSLTGDMLVYFFDLHGEVDSDGSEQEITKEI